MKNLLLALMLLFLAVPAWAEDSPKESTYDRVMRTGTIRCGYYIWPPFLAKDPNTGKISGIASDMMDEIGKQLSLKVEWVAEVDVPTMFEGYSTGRYDMVCAPVSSTPARARVVDFTVPFAYGSYYLYVKEGDLRFDNAHEKVNSPDVRYASLDGDMNSILGSELYPKAQKVALPQMSTVVDLLLNLDSGKADVIAVEPVPAMEFMREHPERIRQVKGGPVRVMPATFAVPIGDEKYKSMLNITLQNMLDVGSIERIFKKYPDYDSTILRIAKPYETK